jgi:hypothetical protein
MALSISGATHPDAVSANKTAIAAQSATSGQKSPQTASKQASPPKDTVQISGAAHAALQEASETATQTAKEALGGDLQARRLLAKEAAAKKA